MTRIFPGRTDRDTDRRPWGLQKKCVYIYTCRLYRTPPERERERGRESERERESERAREREREKRCRVFNPCRERSAPAAVLQHGKEVIPFCPSLQRLFVDVLRYVALAARFHLADPSEFLLLRPLNTICAEDGYASDYFGMSHDYTV